MLDHERFAGVPPTALVSCRVNDPVARGGAGTKVGSLQQFVMADSDCEERGPSAFPVPEVRARAPARPCLPLARPPAPAPASPLPGLQQSAPPASRQARAAAAPTPPRPCSPPAYLTSRPPHLPPTSLRRPPTTAAAAAQVHKICILDIRLANTDRNGSNILARRAGDSWQLVPIDHGYCLPAKFDDISFEWMYWPQVRGWLLAAAWGCCCCWLLLLAAAAAAGGCCWGLLVLVLLLLQLVQQLLLLGAAAGPAALPGLRDRCWAEAAGPGVVAAGLAARRGS